MDADGQDDISTEKTDDARLTLMSPTLEEMERMNQAPKLFVNDTGPNQKSNAEIEESHRLAAKIDEEDKTRFIRIKPHEKKKQLKKNNSKTSQTSRGSKTSKEQHRVQMGYDDIHSFVSTDNTSMRDSMKENIERKVKSVWDTRIEEARAIEVIRKTDSGFFVTRSGTKLVEDDEGNLCDMESGDIVFKTEAIKSAKKIAKMAKARDISNLIRSKSSDGLVSDSGHEYFFDSSGNLVDEEGTVVYTARELEESGKDVRAMSAMMKAEAKEMAWNWPRASFGVGASFGSRASFGLAPSDQTLDKRHSVYSDVRDKRSALGHGESTSAATSAAAAGGMKSGGSRMPLGTDSKPIIRSRKWKSLPSDRQLAPHVRDYLEQYANKQPSVTLATAAAAGDAKGQCKGKGQDKCQGQENVHAYLERHGIHELFRLLTTTLLVNRPSDPLDVLIDITGFLAQQIKSTCTFSAAASTSGNTCNDNNCYTSGWSENSRHRRTAGDESRKSNCSKSSSTVEVLPNSKVVHCVVLFMKHWKAN